MQFTTTSALFVALIAASGANAACSYVSQTFPSWNFKVYTGTGCTGKSYEYYGRALGCKCLNINSPLNDNVNSFVLSTPISRSIKIFQDAGCKGTQLGESPQCYIQCLRSDLLFLSPQQAPHPVTGSRVSHTEIYTSTVC
jgi:hypothetical protein